MSAMGNTHRYRIVNYFFSSTLAGFPTNTQSDGTSFTTTDPAPIITFSPIVISPIMQTLAPMSTLLPILGHLVNVPSASFLWQKVVLFRNTQFSPMTEPLLTTSACP